jgi:putative ABC transport system permease protein
MLVAGQIALTLVLVAGAGLLMRSFVGLTAVDPGFEFENRLAVSLHIWDKYPGPEERAEYFREVRERLTALPAVLSTGASSSVPFGRSSIDMERGYRIADRPEPEPGRERIAFLNYVTPGYLETLGAGLRSGRVIDERDRADTRPVALVSAGVATRHWAGEDPIGRSIVIPGEFEDEPIEIIGVVEDIRHDRLDAEPWAEIYLAQPQDGYGSMTIVARTAGPPAEALDQVKKALYGINPNQTLYSADTLPALLSESLRERRFNLILLSGFALVSLVLSAAGIYGLVSFTTQQRSGEIGVRKAVGAGSRDIFRLVLGRSLGLAAVGIGMGLVAALALTQFLRSMLYGVGTTDPFTFVFVALLLGLVTALATLLPARRAAGADPMVALRAE